MINSTTADRQAPRLGLAGSLLLHACIVAAALFTWSHKIDLADQAPPIVPVDLVTIAQKTNIAPMALVHPKEMQAPAQIAAPAMPLQIQQPKVEYAPAAQRKPEPKTKPMPPKPQQDKFDINNIMTMLDKRKQVANSSKSAKTGAQNIKGIGSQSAMTMDLVDALRNQISQCWSPPVGAPHPETLIVEFELFLNRDGSVAQPPQLTANSGAAVASNPYMRAAADAARRAIYTCEPYKLPADRYSQWHDITLVFDPRMMAGQ
ncbi:MAG: hypothetical protein KGJ79_07395 [Alphaproteobacteria bacterium]|nr:hypothetical protein [Alphaproteobacteria bacterium]MDE2493635.1 hypothetical protein [Alphaproteobacteria bacterium]MDE2500969.1 hypothetical protein [Alphaproteobacteria bacterium]